MMPSEDRKKTKMPPPGAKPSLTVAIGVKPKDAPDEGGMGGKASEAEAIVLRAGDKTCQSCAHYEPMDGSCQQVEGMFDPGDRCLRYYESEGDEANEEANEGEDQGEPAMGAMEK